METAAAALQSQTAVPPIHKALERLAYVIECASTGMLGEGRSELYDLIRSLTSDPTFDFPQAHAMADDLRKAFTEWSRRDVYKGSVILGGVSRRIWAAAASGNAGLPRDAKPS